MITVRQIINSRFSNREVMEKKEKKTSNKRRERNEFPARLITLGELNAPNRELILSVLRIFRLSATDPPL